MGQNEIETSQVRLRAPLELNERVGFVSEIGERFAPSLSEFSFFAQILERGDRFFGESPSGGARRDSRASQRRETTDRGEGVVRALDGLGGLLLGWLFLRLGFFCLFRFALVSDLSRGFLGGKGRAFFFLFPRIARVGGGVLPALFLQIATRFLAIRLFDLFLALRRLDVRLVGERSNIVGVGLQDPVKMIFEPFLEPGGSSVFEVVGIEDIERLAVPPLFVGFASELNVLVPGGDEQFLGVALAPRVFEIGDAPKHFRPLAAQGVAIVAQTLRLFLARLGVVGFPLVVDGFELLALFALALVDALFRILPFAFGLQSLVVLDVTPETTAADNRVSPAVGVSFPAGGRERATVPLKFLPVDIARGLVRLYAALAPLHALCALVALRSARVANFLTLANPRAIKAAVVSIRFSSRFHFLPSFPRNRTGNSRDRKSAIERASNPRSAIS